MDNKYIRKKLIAGVLMGASLLMSQLAWSEQYAANFKGTDIQEFINVVGKNLGKTIIVDPTVRGKINVRSYDLLNDEQYYQFFLNVLQVYGYAVVEMDNNIIKVIKDKDAKTASIRVADDNLPGVGDEMVTRIVALYNTEAKQLAPLLRQLNDNAGGGNVVNYDPSNVLMISGRAAVVNKLVEIVRRVDKQGDTAVEVVPLDFASAGEIVRIVDALYRTNVNKSRSPGKSPKVVADERMNAVLVSGDEKSRKRVVSLIKRLDAEQASTGNTKVRYLKYANAEELVEVLTGVAEKLVDANVGVAPKGAGSKKRNEVNIMADTGTNSLILTAEPDQMRTIESVINQLDIRRAQVLVEAIIVEVAEGDDVAFGVQMGALAGGGTQFNNLGPTLGEVGAGIWEAKPVKASQTCTGSGINQTCTKNPDTVGDLTTLASAIGKVNGMAYAVMMGDFGALIQAVASDTTSNLLSTPSVTTLDNEEATINVGENVPLLSSSQASDNGNSSPFQTVERQDVGVILKVTPQINSGTSVRLVIEQEVSAIQGATAIDVKIATRKVTTTVMADSGEIVVIGGLISESVNESIQKVPFLGDIPIIGWLFRSSSSKKSKSNLMIFIKPTIIADQATMNGVAGRKYNYFRGLQLEQQERGINLMPDSQVPVLEEWDQSKHLSPEVNEILERYKAGKGLDTRMRRTDATLKSISESKQQDAIDAAKEAEVSASNEGSSSQDNVSVSEDSSDE